MSVDIESKKFKMPNGKLSVVIAAMPSAGKSTVAEAVSEALNLKLFVGGNILKAMADQLGYKVTGDNWWETKDGMAFLEKRKANPDWDKIVDRAFKEELKNGGVVMTSWTMPWLSDYGYKIWLNVDFEIRAKRLAKRDSIPIIKAKTLLKKRDDENKLLYKKLYGIDYGEDLKPFDLVLNAGIYNVEQLCKTIIDCLRNLY